MHVKWPKMMSKSLYNATRAWSIKPAADLKLTLSLMLRSCGWIRNRIDTSNGSPSAVSVDGTLVIVRRLKWWNRA